MQQTLQIDKSKGYVALPHSIFELDLSLGAFRTLSELCRRANQDGFCWPSLAQIGDALGKSKAAVSSYVKELRESGLIETESQRMANGYNYRLKFLVTFWSAWRSQFSGDTKPTNRDAEVTPEEPSPTKTERSVHNTERNKNQNHKYQESDSSFPIKKELTERWRSCAGDAPYPAFRAAPDAELLQKTKRLLCKAAPMKPISADIEKQLTDFFVRKFIKVPTAMIRTYVSELDFQSMRDVDSFVEAMNKIWKPFWRNPPTVYQLKKLKEETHDPDTADFQRRLVKTYLDRWELYCKTTSNVA